MKDARRELQAFRRRVGRLKHRAKANGWPCWVCLQPFDWTLPYMDAMAFTADHVTPISRGGHILGELMPAHRSCNSRRNDGRNVERVRTTRRW